MVVRKRRKKNKVRGNRTHGGGGTKNRRGSGNRGGVGRAGSHKHKFSLYYMDFGVKRTFKAGPKDEAVNLEYVSSKVDEWLTEGKAKKENDTVILDGSALGFDKVLGILEEKEEKLNPELKKLIDEREKARKEKNYEKADKIRQQLKEKGIILEDTKEGVRWKKLD